MTVMTNGLFGESYYRDNLTNEINVFVMIVKTVSTSQRTISGDVHGGVTKETIHEFTEIVYYCVMVQRWF